MLTCHESSHARLTSTCEHIEVPPTYLLSTAAKLLRLGDCLTSLQPRELYPARLRQWIPFLKSPATCLLPWRSCVSLLLLLLRTSTPKANTALVSRPMTMSQLPTPATKKSPSQRPPHRQAKRTLSPQCPSRRRLSRGFLANSGIASIAPTSNCLPKREGRHPISG